MTLSTHVLDTARGEPARGLRVRLDRLHADGDGQRRWVAVAEGVTDADGRLRDWVEPRHWGAGRYRLVFDTGGYLGGDAFFPEVVVAFAVPEPAGGRAEEPAAGPPGQAGAGPPGEAAGAPVPHYHVPLLLGPYSYTTYRGS